MRSPGGPIVACGVLLALACGCAGRWPPPALSGDWTAAASTGPLLGVPAGVPVVGLGAKVSARGMIPKRCLSKADSTTAGQSFTVEVHPASAWSGSGDLGVDAFVEGNLQRAAMARPRPGAPEPVAALLVVRTTGLTTLDERSVRFSEQVRSLVGAGDDWALHERCGTHYVQAARRESSALVFVALYPADAPQHAELLARIARREGRIHDDLMTLAVLDQLVEGVATFLALRADADQAFDAVELGLRPPELGRTGALVGNALRAGFGADRGRVMEVSLRPWSQLPAVAAAMRLDGREPRLFQHLKLLEGRALEHQTLLARLAGAAGPGADRCRAALAGSMERFTWDGYYRCRAAARGSLPAALEEVEVCRPVLAALGSGDLPASCESLARDDGGATEPVKRSDTRYPLLLERDADPEAHLFSDEQQFVSISAPVVAGAQTDRRGREFPGACVRTPAAGPAPEPPAPAPPLRPWSQEVWDPLAFRGTGPALAAPRPLDESEEAKEEAAPPGPICIQVPGQDGKQQLCLREKGTEGEAPVAAPVPAPAPKAAPGEPPSGGGQARSEVVLGISASHRFAGERRWPWWKRWLYPLLLSWKEPVPFRSIVRGAYEVRSLQEGSDEEIVLTEEAAKLARTDLAAFYRACGTHRVRQVVERKGIAYYLGLGSPGDLEVSVLPYGVSGDTVNDPALHPERARGLFSGRADLLDRLSVRSPGVPHWLILEPWSELLLEAGVVEPHQLAPSLTGTRRR